MDDPLESDSVSREAGTKKSWRFRAFAGLLTVDSITSLVFLTPFLRWVRVSEGEYSGHYTLYASLLDLAILAALRVTLSLLALLYAYIRAQPEPPADDPSFFHPNGDRKTKDELLEDMLEEPVVSWYVATSVFSYRSVEPCLTRCIMQDSPIRRSCGLSRRMPRHCDPASSRCQVSLSYEHGNWSSSGWVRDSSGTWTGSQSTSHSAAVSRYIPCSGLSSCRRRYLRSWSSFT